MALSEPLALNRNGTYSAPTGGTTTTWNRLDMGSFVDAATTADEPKLLTIKANVRQGGKASDYLIRFDQYKNAGASLPVGSPDAQLSIYTVIRCDYGAFSTTDVKGLLSECGYFVTLTGSAFWDKILRGER